MDLCRIINDDLALTVKENPKRFVALGTLPMQAPELAVQELKRCIKVYTEVEKLTTPISACILIMCRSLASLVFRLVRM